MPPSTHGLHRTTGFFLAYFEHCCRTSTINLHGHSLPSQVPPTTPSPVLASSLATLGRRWFTAFYVYVQHDFIASIIATFSTTPARLLRQPRIASALSSIVRLATVVEAFSASLLSDMV
jgi:hypothetical protein